MNLDQIALSCGTDKSSEIHNYAVKYENHLPFLRGEMFKMLEIGIAEGKSLAMWSRFFPNASITGIDINPESKKYESGNIKVEIGKQEDEDFLKKVNRRHGPFNLVIDDGSHRNDHVVASFQTLFPLLAPGGVYVVEDLCCSYWIGFNNNMSAYGKHLEFFMNLIHDVNFHGVFADAKPRYSRREDWLIPVAKREGHSPEIESMLFLNSMLFITKRKQNA